MNQIKRQWIILTIIPQPPGPEKSTEEIRQLLAEQMQEEISKRTVERDLQALSEEFDIGYRVEGKTYYWSWKDVPKMWLPGLLAEQALAFYMVEQYLKDILPEATLQSLAPFFRAAEDKLNENHNRRRSWKQKFRLIESRQMLRPSKLSVVAARTVRSALLEDQPLRITYRDRGGNKELHETIFPLAITQRGSEQYLVYRNLNDTMPAYLPMQRIKSASPSVAEMPKVNFDIDTYLESGHLGFGKQYRIPGIRVGQEIKLEALFSKKTAERLEETPLADDQKLVPQQGELVLLKATVKFSGQLLWWVLSYGASVEILKPKAFRDFVAKNLKAASDRYDVGD